MAMRNLFFEESSSQGDLSSRAQSDDAFERWSASVELGQINETWAISLLWQLKTDVDENTRIAALNSLRRFAPEDIASSTGAQIPDAIHDSNLQREWKIRTLPELSEQTINVYEAAILDILATEGPTPGARILRLISSSVNPNKKYVVSKHALKKLLAALQHRNLVTRNDFHTNTDELELATYHLTGTPSVVIRKRGNRELGEIPLTELRATLEGNVRAMRRSQDTDFLFKVLVNQFDIVPAEFHVVGRLLEKEWSGLFRFDKSI